MNTKINFLGNIGTLELDIDIREREFKHFTSKKYLVTVDWSFDKKYHAIMGTLEETEKTSALYALGRLAYCFSEIDRKRDITWLDVLAVCESFKIEGMLIDKF